MHSKMLSIFLNGGVTLKHKNFFMVPNSIFELELKPRELAVYCCLLKYCDEDMTCYPSRSTIGKDCCIDECTVDKALGGLIQKGLVQKSSRFFTDGARDSNLYTLASFIETA